MNFNLIKDNPNKTETMCGVIQKVDEPFMTDEYYYNGSEYEGRILTINNEEYYIAYNGFNKNTYVEIEYLPNSRVIMTIELCEND